MVVVLAEGEHAGESGVGGRSWLTWVALLGWLGLSTYIGTSDLFFCWFQSRRQAEDCVIWLWGVIGMCNSISMVIIQMASPCRGALGAINGISTAVQ